MAIGKATTDYCIVPGVRLASLSCGIKEDGSNDLVMFEFVKGSVTAGVFTKSLFAAAPVEVGKNHLSLSSPRYFVINSGNANAGVGEQGIDDALVCCKTLSEQTGVGPEAIIPFSTGVIGERLPVAKITNAYDRLLADLSESNWIDAAKGIMTTDTRPKIASRQIEINGNTVTLTGIAKGSGMIQPNMATMLCYLATDIKTKESTLQEMLKTAVDKSFNRITVDSDTSTNDSTMLTATGISEIDVDSDTDWRETFENALQDLCLTLAQGIIRDAEGVTKFITVNVRGGKNQRECLEIAYSVANSPLMKTALFASDANWGRIVMAIGKADVDIDINKLDVHIGDTQLMSHGTKHKGFTEEAGAAVFSEEEISISVNLNAGGFEETVWTSDLSHEYVRINAEYRT